MIRKILHMDKGDCCLLARQIFEQRMGPAGKGSCVKRKRQRALQAAAFFDEQVSPKAAYVFFDQSQVTLTRCCARLGGTGISCKAFSQMEPQTIKGAYIFVLSIGNIDLSGETMTQRVYADLWGSAYVDAARILLQKELEQHSLLSECFGPGFFGMEMGEMRAIDEIVRFDCIDARIESSGAILPPKSSAGLYFSVTDEYEPLGQPCKTCKGNHRGCEYCGQREKGLPSASK